MVLLTYDVRNVSPSLYAVSSFLPMQVPINQPAYGNVITRPLTFIKGDQQIFSMLGRVNYTFDNKYILTATVRRDGVSKFSKDNRFGVFPSLALAWNAGNEDFIKNLDVLLVEDIIDTGHTLNQVIKLLKNSRPKSLEVCCLLNKF